VDKKGNGLARKVSRRSSNIMTIHDVARYIGMSPMTVSRVINGEKNVREETRQKVSDAIEALNYSPNMAARSLASQDHARIALIYSNPSMSFLSEFLLGSLSQSVHSGCQLVIEACEGPKVAIEVLKRLKQSGTDGVILPPPLSDSELVAEALKDMNMRFVCVAASRSLDDISSVRIDDFEAAFSMTQKLIDLGHTQIGLIKGQADSYYSQLRFEGYAKALKVAGIALDPNLVAQGEFTYRSGFNAAESLLSQTKRPTAIFPSNDDMAAGAVAAAHRLGLDVPKDVTITGFDDTSMASTVWPELTTVRQPISEMAALALKMLVDQIRAGRQGVALRALHEIQAFSIIERQSSAAPQKPKSPKNT
jgi:LacI family transcriptional regulator